MALAMKPTCACWCSVAQFLLQFPADLIPQPLRTCWRLQRPNGKGLVVKTESGTDYETDMCMLVIGEQRHIAVVESRMRKTRLQTHHFERADACW